MTEPDGAIPDAPGRLELGEPRGERVIKHRSARTRRGRERPRITLNLVAMIDVTFLVLVYFLSATEFRRGEEVYRLDLPPRLQSNRERDPFQLFDEPLRIEVTSLGADQQQYRLRIEGPFEQPVTFDELESYMRSWQINVGTGGFFMPDHPVLIKPARTATWDHALAAFNAAARARYTNVKFAQTD